MTISNTLVLGAFGALSPSIDSAMTAALRCGIQMICERALRWAIDTYKTINSGAGQAKSGSSAVKTKRLGSLFQGGPGANRCLPGAGTEPWNLMMRTGPALASPCIHLDQYEEA